MTELGAYAFNKCTSLQEITIPTSVNIIGCYAFSECTSLTEITIPASVNTIGAYAFYQSGLTSAILAESNSWKKLTYTYTRIKNTTTEEYTYTYDLSDAEKAAAALKGGVKLCTSAVYGLEEDDSGQFIWTYHYTTFTWYAQDWTRAS